MLINLKSLHVVTLITINRVPIFRQAKAMLIPLLVIYRRAWPDEGGRLRPGANKKANDNNCFFLNPQGRWSI